MTTPAVISFEETVAQLRRPELLETCACLNTLQVNITTQCNLACKHCHVEGSPAETKAMDKETLAACLRLFDQNGFSVIDITGGAPEMHPHYRWFVTEAAGLARKRGGKVITRCNLVILTEDGYEDLPALWAELGVELAVSLPSWEARISDKQRGEGSFERAIHGLKLLNAVGYGTGAYNAEGEPLLCNIVVNPGGAFLPPAQASAEREFREKLGERYGVQFDALLTITNNPVGRFERFLEKRGKKHEYLIRLYKAFNPATVENMMCRSQVSVRWDGRLYDCDFNQTLDWEVSTQTTVSEAAEQGLGVRKIRFGDHCYACTAGAGSSCGGATT